MADREPQVDSDYSPMKSSSSGCTIGAMALGILVLGGFGSCTVSLMPFATPQGAQQAVAAVVALAALMAGVTILMLRKHKALRTQQFGLFALGWVALTSIAFVSSLYSSGQRRPLLLDQRLPSQKPFELRATLRPIYSSYYQVCVFQDPPKEKPPSGQTDPSPAPSIDWKVSGLKEGAVKDETRTGWWFDQPEHWVIGSFRAEANRSYDFSAHIVDTSEQPNGGHTRIIVQMSFGQAYSRTVGLMIARMAMLICGVIGVCFTVATIVAFVADRRRARI
jgi:hypothetical protein